MTGTTLFRAAVAVLASTAALAARAQAQTQVQTRDPRGPFVAVGVGISSTREPGADLSRVGSSAELQAGWVLSPKVAVMLEGSAHGPGGKAPEPVSGSLDPAAVVAPPQSRLVGTLSVLAAVQVATPAGVYVRPGVGAAAHSFGRYTVFPAGDSGVLYVGQIGYEWGPAAGLAVGRAVGPRSFPLKVEAVGLWSGGEDSTHARWSAGLQFVHDFRF